MQPKSKFVRVKCNDCGNEQNVFGCAASDVKCLVCGKILVRSQAGKANIVTKIVKVLE